MGRHYTGIQLLDNLVQLNISKLKQWGYLEDHNKFSGTINWSVRGNTIGEVAFKIDFDSLQPYIDLIYNYKGVRKLTKVHFIKVESNLKRGCFWYFQCPKTFKRCRKLYLYHGDFIHRDACTFVMYESQAKTKEERFLDVNYGDYFNQEKIYKEYNRKHRKKKYKGIPTKREQVLISKLDKANKVDYRDIERMMIFGVK